MGDAMSYDPALDGPRNKDEQFNKLTPAESERLYILMEEMGEAIQIIGKILRHGYESRHPNGGTTNRKALEHELGDTDQALQMLCKKGDLSIEQIHKMSERKSISVQKYLHHQK